MGVGVFPSEAEGDGGTAIHVCMCCASALQPLRFNAVSVHLIVYPRKLHFTFLHFFLCMGWGITSFGEEAPARTTTSEIRQKKKTTSKALEC